MFDSRREEDMSQEQVTLVNTYLISDKSGMPSSLKERGMSQGYLVVTDNPAFLAESKRLPTPCVKVQVNMKSAPFLLVDRQSIPKRAGA